MKAKNIVVTGGNNGIGYETVKGLYQDGRNIIFESRNEQRNNAVVEELAKLQGGSIKCYGLDLSRKVSVEEFAKNIKV